MSTDIDQLIRPLNLKDLRSELRARGENPGGGLEDLRIRLKENMASSGNYSLGSGSVAPTPQTNGADHGPSSFGGGNAGGNNYIRPSGQQNVGNYISDRPTSRVLAPPGGSSQINFGGHDAHPAPPARAPQPQYLQQQYQQPAAVPHSPTPPRQGSMQSSSAAYGSGHKEVVEGNLKNNYSRPGGMQNVGNMLTDRPSSKVLAPPGGKSQISFG